MTVYGQITLIQKGDTLRCFTTNQEAIILTSLKILDKSRSVIDSVNFIMKIYDDIIDICDAQKKELIDKQKHYDHIINSRQKEIIDLENKYKKQSRRTKQKKVFNKFTTGVLFGMVFFLMLK